MNLRLQSVLFETAALTAALFVFAAATKPAMAQPDMTDRTIGDKIDDDL